MLKEERKKESGWPIEDDELDNVSGGMRPAVAGTTPCPKCGQDSEYTGSGNEWKCPTCGCRWNVDTGEILN